MLTRSAENCIRIMASRYARRLLSALKGILLIVFILNTPLANANDDDDALLKFMITDKKQEVSGYLVYQIFGAEGVTKRFEYLATGKYGAVAKTISYFNQFVLAFALVLLLYGICIGVYNIARSGRFLDEKNSFWTPVRNVVGIVLLIPKASGYCMLQTMTLAMVYTGIEMADLAWGKTLDLMGSKSIFGATVPADEVFNNSARELSQDIRDVMQNAICVASHNYTLEQDDNPNKNNNPYAIGSILEGGKYKVIFGAPDATHFQSSILDNKPDAFTSASRYCGTAQPSENTKESTGRLLDFARGVNKAAQDVFRSEKPDNLQSPQQSLVDKLKKSTDREVALLVHRIPVPPPLNTSDSSRTGNYGYYGWAVAGMYYRDLAKPYTCGASYAKGIQRYAQSAVGWAGDTVGSAVGMSDAGAALQNAVGLSTGSICKVDAKSQELRVISDQGKSPPKETFKIVSDINTAYSNLSSELKTIKNGPIPSAGEPTGNGSGTATNSQTIDEYFNTLEDKYSNTSGKGGLASSGYDPNEFMRKILSTGSFDSEDVFGAIIQSVSNYQDDVNIAILAAVYTSMGLLLGATIMSGQGNPVAGIFYQLVSQGNAIAMFCLFFIYSVTSLITTMAPMTPIIIYLTCFLGWLVQVIIAVVAAPIICMGMIWPDAQDPYLGKAAPALMMYINLLFRPVLMLIGFLIAIVILPDAIRLFALVFTGAMKAAEVTSLTNDAIAIHFVNFIVLMTFLMLLIGILSFIFALTYELPDRIMTWLGGEVQGFGKESASGAVDAAQSDFQKDLGKLESIGGMSMAAMQDMVQGGVEAVNKAVDGAETSATTEGAKEDGASKDFEDSSKSGSSSGGADDQASEGGVSGESGSDSGTDSGKKKYDSGSGGESGPVDTVRDQVMSMKTSDSDVRKAADIVAAAGSDSAAIQAAIQTAAAAFNKANKGKGLGDQVKALAALRGAVGDALREGGASSDDKKAALEALDSATNYNMTMEKGCRSRDPSVSMVANAIKNPAMAASVAKQFGVTGAHMSGGDLGSLAQAQLMSAGQAIRGSQDSAVLSTALKFDEFKGAGKGLSALARHPINTVRKMVQNSKEKRAGDAGIFTRISSANKSGGVNHKG